MSSNLRISINHEIGVSSELEKNLRAAIDETVNNVRNQFSKVMHHVDVDLKNNTVTITPIVKDLPEMGLGSTKMSVDAFQKGAFVGSFLNMDYEALRNSLLKSVGLKPETDANVKPSEERVPDQNDNHV